MADTGAKTQLTLTRCFVRPEGTVQIDSSVSFTAMVNPTELRHERSIAYSNEMNLGQVGSDPKFSAIKPDTLSFSLVLDGTGVVPANAYPNIKDVRTLLQQLDTVVHRYVDNKHEPAHVRLLWGTTVFVGRLSSMKVNYTLFKPSGDPLRAKVEMSFLGSMSKKEGELSANRNSPDLSHDVLVLEGDTLPLLCDRIYGDSAYYMAVARFNGLADPRALHAGQRLHFPPLA